MEILIEVDSVDAMAYAVISGEGDWPSVQDVVDALKNRDVPYWIDEAAIKSMIQSHSPGRRVAVAKAKDGEVLVSVGPGEKEAHIVVQPAYGGREMTAADALNVLASKSIRTGVDNDAVERAFSPPSFGRRVLVARAKEPIHGNDAVITYSFRTRSIISPKEVEGKRIDYKDLETVVSVTKGSVLATKTPPTNGENGFTVTGRTLPAKPGKDDKLAAGKNTKLSTDRLQVTSDIDGQPILRDKTITVESVLNVDGDIDYTTGNIIFAGSVRVVGNVVSGFTLKASENIHVEGLVEDSFLEAGGDVLVKGGIQGASKGTIKARGNVNALFIERATVEAGKCITTCQSLHSNLLAGDRIVITQEKGQLCGGTAGARNLVQANIIGSEAGTHTEVAVGFEPMEKARLEELKAEKAEREAALEEAEKGLAVLEQYRNEGVNWSERLDKAYERLYVGRKALDERLVELNAEVKSLEESLDKAETPEVKVRKIIFPNVKIKIRDFIHENRVEETNAAFFEHDGLVESKPYVD
jgi:uncharacterized protein (DUF342 family)